ncbi:MAG: inositol monophosphatase [Candidatus Hydrogenedentales bacterium]
MDELAFISGVLADIAPLVRERYADRSALAVLTKSGVMDLVTAVDTEVQERIVTRIQQEFRGDCIIAEESGLHRPPETRAERCWYIDPIDGTQNFVRALFPAFGVSIAFGDSEQAHAAGVALPMLNMTFLAQRGAGATRDDRRIRVSQVAELEAAKVEVDFGAPQVRQQTLAEYTAVMARAGQVRSYCSAVVGLCSVAAGDSDAYCHSGLAPWDYAAAALIVEEAGGTVTRPDGAPVRLSDELNRGIVASNGRLHAACLDTVVLARR